MTKQEFYKKLASIYTSEEAKTLYYIILQHMLDAPLSLALVKEMEGLSAQHEKRFEEITKRLMTHEPIQYILGECEFRSEPWIVTPDVLIPRPETSELIDWICDDWAEKKGEAIDIGTGSGCIAISLKNSLPLINMHATDISDKALTIAKKNAERKNATISFVHDNILESHLTPQKEFDFIVSNPPYIMNKEKSDMEATVLNFEPHTALFVSDEDPLIFYREIAKFGKKYLKKGGYLYFEINALLGKECIKMLEEIGYSDILLKKDEYQKERMIRCKK